MIERLRLKLLDLLGGVDNLLLINHHCTKCNCTGLNAMMKLMYDQNVLRQLRIPLFKPLKLKKYKKGTKIVYVKYRR